MAFGFTLLVFILVYIGLIIDRWPKQWIVTAGASALLLGQVLTLKEALAYVNGSSLFILLILFIVVELLSLVGFFEWLSKQIVRRFHDHPTVLFLGLPLVAGLFSTAINNITVMVFMTTLTLQICEEIPLPLLPLMAGEVCCANMLGAATLIGAPPNLVMATTLGYGFERVALHMAPLVMVATGVFMVVHYFQHRQELHSHAKTGTKTPKPVQPKRIRIDIETLIFFTGLFILVGALDHVGLFVRLAQTVSTIHQPVILFLAILWLSAIASAFVDNIPMALAMAYLIKNLSALSSEFPAGIVVWAALLGLTLGGNMTPIGASPNVVAYGLLEKENVAIGWKRWASLTVPATLCALVVVSVLTYAKYRSGWY